MSIIILSRKSEELAALWAFLFLPMSTETALNVTAELFV
jgi:hypothetical protein